VKKTIKDEFEKAIRTKGFKEWQEKEHKEQESRIHCDRSTRAGKIKAIIDGLDNLGLCVCKNGKRDQDGKLLYNEKGEIELIDGETEPIFLSYIDFTK
jgi:hypothetical protein